ncbi:hypothetical protein LA02_1231 [Francisella philomiragia]|nr:hypothetical protein LA02_1231 [Francisella philomiragia]
MRSGKKNKHSFFARYYKDDKVFVALLLIQNINGNNQFLNKYQVTVREGILGEMCRSFMKDHKYKTLLELLKMNISNFATIKRNAIKGNINNITPT